MKVLITGICGFAGSSLAEGLLERHPAISILGVDNLMRPGSELNRARLRKLGIAFAHGDIRNASDLESLPAVEWVIDAAANPSVLAGIQSGFSSRQLVEHNLASVVNVLEYCKARHAGLVLLSTSRVYSIQALKSLPLRAEDGAFHLDEKAGLPGEYRPKASEKTSLRTRPSPCTGAPSWRPKRWRSNTARRSIFRSGSIAVACWPEPDSLGRPIRESSRIGFMPTCGVIRCASLVSTGRAGKHATCFIRAISLGFWMLRWAQPAAGASDSTARRGPRQCAFAGRLDGLVRCAVRRSCSQCGPSPAAVRHTLGNYGLGRRGARFRLAY